MSICSSRFNSDIDSDCEIKTLDSKMRRFKKVTYEEVEYSLNKHYTKELQISFFFYIRTGHDTLKESCECVYTCLKSSSIRRQFCTKTGVLKS